MLIRFVILICNDIYKKVFLFYYMTDYIFYKYSESYIVLYEDTYTTQKGVALF